MFIFVRNNGYGPHDSPHNHECSIQSPASYRITNATIKTRFRTDLRQSLDWKNPWCGSLWNAVGPRNRSNHPIGALGWPGAVPVGGIRGFSPSIQSMDFMIFELRQPTKSRSDEIRTLKKNEEKKCWRPSQFFGKKNPSSIGGDTLPPQYFRKIWFTKNHKSAGNRSI